MVGTGACPVNKGGVRLCDPALSNPSFLEAIGHIPNLSCTSTPKTYCDPALSNPSLLETIGHIPNRSCTSTPKVNQKNSNIQIREIQFKKAPTVTMSKYRKMSRRSKKRLKIINTQDAQLQEYVYANNELTEKIAILESKLKVLQRKPARSKYYFCPKSSPPLRKSNIRSRWNIDSTQTDQLEQTDQENEVKSDISVINELLNKHMSQLEKLEKYQKKQDKEIQALKSRCLPSVKSSSTQPNQKARNKPNLTIPVPPPLPTSPPPASSKPSMPSPTPSTKLMKKSK